MQTAYNVISNNKQIVEQGTIHFFIRNDRSNRSSYLDVFSYYRLLLVNVLYTNVLVQVEILKHQ